MNKSTTKLEYNRKLDWMWEGSTRSTKHDRTWKCSATWSLVNSLEFPHPQLHVSLRNRPHRLQLWYQSNRWMRPRQSI